MGREISFEKNKELEILRGAGTRKILRKRPWATIRGRLPWRLLSRLVVCAHLSRNVTQTKA
ncbi:unnamed protein product, partial [Nesidiocoris tenuis]